MIVSLDRCKGQEGYRQHQAYGESAQPNDADTLIPEMDAAVELWSFW